MHKSDRTAAGCTVEDEPYKLLERDAEKSILAGPLSSPSEQLPFPASLKAPVPLTHDAVTVPVMFGPNITGSTGSVVGYSGQSASGAFSRSDAGDATLQPGRLVTTASISFKASDSSSKYGGASSVQPPSLRLLACIKS